MYFNLSNFNWFIARRPMSNTDDIKEIYYYHFSIKHTIKTAILLFFAYTFKPFDYKKAEKCKPTNVMCFAFYSYDSGLRIQTKS